VLVKLGISNWRAKDLEEISNFNKTLSFNYLYRFVYQLYTLTGENQYIIAKKKMGIQPKQIAQ
jgi:hypothetical protein